LASALAFFGVVVVVVVAFGAVVLSDIGSGLVLEVCCC